MTQRQIFALGFFIILLVLLYQIAIVFRPFLLPVLWAVILAHIAFPLHRRLSARLGNRKGLSAAILTVAIIGLVVVPLVIFIVQLIEEAGIAYMTTKSWIDGGGLKEAPGQLSQWWICPTGSRSADSCTRRPRIFVVKKHPSVEPIFRRTIDRPRDQSLFTDHELSRDALHAVLFLQGR